jgi:hypothetical protein
MPADPCRRTASALNAGAKAAKPPFLCGEFFTLPALGVLRV